MGTRIAVLNAGVLQQLDTPSNLYRYPKNRFVAGFIGSPAMNFFDAMLRTVDGKLVLETDSFTVDVPGELKERFESHAGKSVVFGVRPEDIHDPDYQPTGTLTAIIEVNVDVVEQMGHEMIVYFELDGKTFLGRLDPRTQARVGMKMGAALNMANMHLFDTETDESLWLPEHIV